jgi:hypothetical protein
LFSSRSRLIHPRFDLIDEIAFFQNCLSFDLFTGSVLA